MNDPLSALATLEGVPSAVTAARDAADVIQRDRGRKVIPAEISAKALLAGARASAAIEDDLAAPAPEGGWQAAAIRLSTELFDLAGLIRTAPGQALARMHALLGQGWVPDPELGRVRPEAAARISGLNQLLSGSTQASPVVVAAIAHAEVATIEPFGAGDGIIARAVEHAVLIAGGIDPRAILVPEAGHRAAGRGYARALQGYATGDVNGVRGWILHCAQALTYGVEVSPLAG
ncbi:oxidoreductase [Granulicoccus phenolivorans]|uniref:oxidoreductase n=1 Tax=Granulicoccus phenolivorans TaxID=266854 RepID=UPI001B7FA471|nr:oxidoreductase [Granulicoccus phenolivorans]